MINLSSFSPGEESFGNENYPEAYLPANNFTCDYSNHESVYIFGVVEDHRSRLRRKI
jgi:hypothetical protein